MPTVKSSFQVLEGTNIRLNITTTASLLEVLEKFETYEEAWNPGGFIDGVTLDNLLSVEPHGKNPTLVDVLKRIGLTEKTGREIDRIYEGSIIYGRPWTDYSESTSNNVKLFIQRSKADENFTRYIIEEQEKIKRHLSIYSFMILSLLNEENMITIDKIAKKQDVFITKQDVANLLNLTLDQAYKEKK